uniref:Uncharacterized protein n=1 Tax=Arundo donax TaxID=35708 RepID=A0A0A9F199_ARUDO
MNSFPSVFCLAWYNVHHPFALPWVLSPQSQEIPAYVHVHFMQHSNSNGWKILEFRCSTWY